MEGFSSAHRYAHVSLQDSADALAKLPTIRMSGYAETQVKSEVSPGNRMMQNKASQQWVHHEPIHFHNTASPIGKAARPAAFATPRPSRGQGN